MYKGIKDEYYKKTENLLYNYKTFKISILNMKEEIKNLKEEDGVKAIIYNGNTSSPTNKFSSSTEDTAMYITEKIDYLERSIKRMQGNVDSIDKSLNGLTEKERDVIIERYIEGRQWWQVAYNINYSERQCRNFRKTAIIKITISIFGDIAVLLPYDCHIK